MENKRFCSVCKKKVKGNDTIISNGVYYKVMCNKCSNQFIEKLKK